MDKEKEIVELFRVAKKAADAAAELSAEPEEIRCLDALKQLKEFPVNYQVLFSTQVGKQVRALTKHPSHRIRVFASELIDTWKKLIATDMERAQKNENGVDKASGHKETQRVVKASVTDIVPVKKRSTSKSIKVEGDVRNGEVSVKKIKLEVEHSVKDEKLSVVEKPSDGREAAPRKLNSLVKCQDDLRDKLRESLYEALSKVAREVNDECKDSVENSDTFRVVANVESAMFEKWGRTNGSQRAKYRSVMFNINDSKNPDFRRKVLLGHISPEKIPTLTTEDMASDERRSKNNDIKMKALIECEREAGPKSTTDQFKCGRCGQRKTTYYQMQTRSADEPMTTFVTCVNCNNRWKFC